MENTDSQNKDLSKLLDELILVLYGPEIAKKIKEGKEITDSDKENYLQYLYNSATQSIKNVNNIKKPKLSLISLTGKIIKNNKQLGIVSNLYSRQNDKKIINNELLKGIRITSNNMTLDNFKILTEQADEISTYNDNYLNIINRFKECRESYKQDFSSITTEDFDKLDESKQKIKALTKKIH